MKCPFSKKKKEEKVFKSRKTPASTSMLSLPEVKCKGHSKGQAEAAVWGLEESEIQTVKRRADQRQSPHCFPPLTLSQNI